MLNTINNTNIITKSTTKICRICGLEKNIEEFSTHSGTKDGLDSRCKKCVGQIKNNSDRTRKPLERDLEKTNYEYFDWQGGKYAGTIFKRKNSNIYTVNVESNSKTFNPSNYSSEEDALEDARKWKKEISDKLGLTKNKYKIVPYMDKKYVIVKLSRNYITLIDIEDLNIVKDYILFSENSANNGKTYCGMLKDDKMKNFHNIITGYPMVDHKNRYPLDNRKDNLRNTNHSENNRIKTIENKSFVKWNGHGFDACLVYEIDAKYNCIYEKFNTKGEGYSWLRKKRYELYIDNMPEEENKLKIEFEKIMTQYGDGFKWCDMDLESNKIMDEIINNGKKQIKEEMLFTTQKKNIYQKFIEQIDKNYDIPDDLIQPGIKIEHIEHKLGEYKYCSKCEKWKLIEDFFKNEQNYDGLDKRCKDCKKESSKDIRKNKALNNEKSRHNKKLTAYQKFIDQIDKNFILGDEYFELSKNIKHIFYNNKEYKYCNRCELWKTIDNFYAKNNVWDKLHIRCKSCEYEYMKERRQKSNNKDDDKDDKNNKEEVEEEKKEDEKGEKNEQKKIKIIIKKEKKDKTNNEKIKIEKLDTEDIRRDKISNTLSEFYNTDDGKEKKKKALGKRSETMAKKREEFRKTVESKICNTCKVDLLAEKFNKKASAKDGLQANCKECTLKIKQNWREERKK